MRRLLSYALIILLFSAGNLFAQEVLRGEVRVDLEPVYGEYVDQVYPLDTESAYRRALEESALFYAAMIYGWSFEYAIGEKARGIAEGFELSPLGTIPFGDPGLYVTDAQVRDMRLYLWTDYRLNEAQKRRMGVWKSGKVQTAQAIGHGPLGDPVEVGDWLSIKKAALEDAARVAVRTMLRGSERNRPKEVRGYIGLAGFPTYWMDAGQWAASTRFRVEIKEIIPFGAY
ncbi:MAG: hypothetical protein LBK43_01740 [Treponema sp.]|nr:hypothetical protein [Treponema sp.]